MQQNLVSDRVELQAMTTSEDADNHESEAFLQTTDSLKGKVFKVSEGTARDTDTCSCFSIVETDQLSQDFLQEMPSDRCPVRDDPGTDLFSGCGESSVHLEEQ